MEKHPQENNAEENESLEREQRTPWRQYLITGLGAAAVFTSAMYKDKDGNDVADKFFDIATAEAVEKSKANLSKDEYERFSFLATLVEKKLGRAGLAKISDLERNQQGDAENQESREPEVIGFEKTGVISNETVSALLGPKFFPQGWVNGRIGSVKYDEGMSDKTASRTKASAKNENRHGIGLDTITFAELFPEHYVINENQDKLKAKALGTVLKILRHEVCHSNDWRDRSNNTFMERLELLAAVIERTESEDHYSDGSHVTPQGEVGSYHEINGVDTRSNRSTTYEEYFATICAAYLSDPKAFAVSNPKDFSIMDSWIKKQDPDFNSRAVVGGPFNSQSGEVTDWAKQLLQQ